MENIENKYFIDKDRFNCPFCHNRAVKYVVLGIAQFDEKNDRKLHAVFVECSHCHKISMHLLKYPLVMEENFLLLSSWESEFKTYCHGNNCQLKAIIKDFDFLNEATVCYQNKSICCDEDIIMSIPTSFFTIDERIPRKLRDLISEAEKCIQNNCLTGASACIRKAIYEFLLTENAAGNSYEEKMKSLKGNKYKFVDDDHIDILVGLQGIMCDQVHEMSIHDKFKSEEAKVYIELLKEIFNQVYVLPAELKSKKSQISTMLGSLKR